MSINIFSLKKLISILVNLFLIHSVYGVENLNFENRESSSDEIFEEKIDLAAVKAQDRAISTLKKLIIKYKNTQKEAELIFKLGKVYREKSEMQFRIAHSASYSQKKNIDLKAHHATLWLSVNTFTEVINKYPGFYRTPEALFLRGKAYEELAKIELAEKDYLVLIDKHSNISEISAVYMSLGVFEVDREHYKKAIQYLNNIESDEDSPYYPFALYKIAWSYYQLKNFSQALNYLERQLNVYKATKSTSNLAIRETSLGDFALFYLGGFEHDISQFSLSSALDRFNKVSDQIEYERIVVRFSSLLKAHDHEKALLDWKEIVKSDNRLIQARFKTFAIIFDYYWENRQPSVLTSILDEIKAYYVQVKKFDDIIAFQDKLLQSARELREQILKNKKSSKVSELTQVLAKLYSTFAFMTSENDPRVPGVHYNLAETLFEIKDFSASTEHYRWIIDHGYQLPQISKSTLTLKMISSRYQELKAKQIIPQKLTVKIIDLANKESIEEDKKKEPVLLWEWVAWVDQLGKNINLETGNKEEAKEKESFVLFLFELNRALYANGWPLEAFRRIENFIDSHKDSQFSVALSSLMIDTYLKGKNWLYLYKTAIDHQKVFKETNNLYSKKLFKIASETYYNQLKLLFDQNKKEELLSQIDEFTGSLKNSEKAIDALLLAAQAAKDLKDYKQAEAYYSKVIELADKLTSGEFDFSKEFALAFLYRGQVYEENFSFQKAAQDYFSFLEKSKDKSYLKLDQIQNIKKKTLWLSWISTEEPFFESVLKNDAICDSKNEEIKTECERFSSYFDFQYGPHFSSVPYKRATTSKKNLRPLWALVALKWEKNLKYQDRLLLMRVIAGRWKSLEGYEKFILSSFVVNQFPVALEENRKEIQKFAPVKSSEAALLRRIKKMKEMEDVCATIMTRVTSHEVKPLLLVQMASMYQDFISEVKGLAETEKLPQSVYLQLVLPFEDKYQGLLKQSFEVASFWKVKQQYFDPISKLFFENNPSQAKSLKGNVQVEDSISFDFSILDQLDIAFEWENLKKHRDDFDYKLSQRLVGFWFQALNENNQPLMAYLLDRLEKMNDLPEIEKAFMRMIQLDHAGLVAQSSELFEEILTQLKPEQQLLGQFVLLKNGLRYLDKKGVRHSVQTLLNILNQKNINQDKVLEDLDGDKAFLFGYGAVWAGLSLPSALNQRLLNNARNSHHSEYAEWSEKQLENFNSKSNNKKSSKKMRPLAQAR